MVQYITHTTNHLNTVLCIDNNPEKCPFLVPVLLSVCKCVKRAATAPKPMRFLIPLPSPKPQMKLGPRGRQRARHERAHQPSYLKTSFTTSSVSVSENRVAFKGGNNVVQNQEPA